MTFAQYHAHSRRLDISLTFIMPLLVAYEVGVILCQAGIENEVALRLIKLPLRDVFGIHGLLVFNGAMILAFLVAFALAEDVEGTRADMYLGMVVESAAFAIALGTVVLGLVGALYGLASVHELLSVAWPSQDRMLAVTLSIGAGVYEELFFRLVLISGILVLVRRLMVRAFADPVEPDCWSAAALAAVVVSSLLFSLAHHLGPAGEPFALRPFAYRYLCGVILAVIYLWRGLGIAVWTHAFYDILLDIRHFG